MGAMVYAIVSLMSMGMISREACTHALVTMYQLDTGRLIAPSQLDQLLKNEKTAAYRKKVLPNVERLNRFMASFTAAAAQEHGEASASEQEQN